MKKVFFFFLFFFLLNATASPSLRCEIQAKLTGKKDLCASMLYAFVAEGVDITHESGKNYTLKFTEVSSVYTYFSDRPDRIVGSNRIEKLASHWSTGSDSFGKVPPNTAIEGFSLQNNQITKQAFVFELMQPDYNPQDHSLTFKAILLDSQASIPNNISLEDVSVFIDSYWGGGYG